MKLSLAAAAAVTTFALLAAGCDDATDTTTPAPPRATDDGGAAAPATTPRKLVESGVIATSPSNLLLDPGFGLVGGQPSFGAFLAFVDGTFDQVDLTTTTDSRSPAGFGGSVAIVTAPGASNTKSDPLLLLTSIPGGNGPFDAQVFVSKTSIGGAPVDVPTDKKSIRASLVDGTPDGTAYDLEVVDDATRTAGGRTWVLLRATVDHALPYGGFFVVHTGSGGGQFLLAAPEVLARDVTAAATTQSLRPLQARAAGRAQTAAERTAIARYRSLPPRLLPATIHKPL